MSPHHHHGETEGIAHHPSEELLLGYASGALDEATSLIVAVHLAYCAACRLQSRKLEALGGSLLQELAPVPMSGGALDAALLKLDGIKPFERPARPESRDGTPSVLRRYIGGDLKDVRWRQVGPRLAYVPLLRHGNGDGQQEAYSENAPAARPPQTGDNAYSTKHQAH